MNRSTKLLALAAYLALCGCSASEPPNFVTTPDLGTDAAVSAQDAATAPNNGKGDTSDVQDLGVQPDAALADPLRDPSCAVPGCLRGSRSLGDFGLDSITPYVDPGVELDNGYTVWVIEYATSVAGELVTSTATVAIPFPATPAANGYHIVANAHGTVGIDDRCKLSGTIYGSGLAGLFGGRGMIGVATDYVGLGTPGLHPYLVSEAEAASVLDSLRAAQNLAKGLDVRTSERFAVVGLSQGGHATLAAAAAHQSYAPELDIRAFGASGPASAWLEHWSEGVATDGPHLTYHALLIYAWAETMGHVGAPLWATGFADDVSDFLERRCIFDFGGSAQTYDEVMPTVATDIFDADFLQAYRAQNLAAYPVLADGFESNRIAPFEQTAPLAIWQGDLDDTVLERHTSEMVSAFESAGMEVDYRRVPEAGHIDLAFGYVAQAQLRTDESLAWIREHLDR